MSKTAMSGAGAGVPVDPQDCFGTVGTFTLTRIAAGNYSLNLTAAANSPFLIIPITDALRLTSFDVCYSIGTAGLTTLTAGLYRKQIVSGSAAAMTTLLAPATLPVTVTTNILVRNVVVAAAPGIDAGAHEGINVPSNNPDYFPDTQEFIELAIVNPGTAVFVFHGAWLYGDKLF